MKNMIFITHECENCNGTGIYTGYAEEQNVGVVCKTCKGTGMVESRHKKFMGKKEREDISFVIEHNPGIFVNEEIAKEVGLEYDDWFAGKPFSEKNEMRSRFCPQEYYQCCKTGKRPDWDECRKVILFYKCENYRNKSDCWERFDKNNE